MTLSHGWEVTPAEARAIQLELAARAEREDRLDDVRTVAGVDAGYHRAHRLVRAAVAVLSYPSLELLDRAVWVGPSRFPYVPGLLSFREVPAIVAALDRLGARPDLVLCDAQGFAHPRRFGLACHLGVLLDLPTIGVAKTRLIGEHRAVPARRGRWAALVDKGETIGAVLRTRERVKPVYVSTGHRVCLESAIRWTMACTTRYRLPETTRQSHRLASNEPWEP